MHVNEIIQKEERSQKHDQMLELVIVLFIILNEDQIDKILSDAYSVHFRTTLRLT